MWVIMIKNISSDSSTVFWYLKSVQINVFLMLKYFIVMMMIKLEIVSSPQSTKLFHQPRCQWKIELDFLLNFTFFLDKYLAY